MSDKPHTTVSQQQDTGDWSRINAEPLSSESSGLNTTDTSPREDVPPNGINSRGDKISEQTVADMRANRNLREIYAEKAYQLAAGCISMWIVLLGVQGVVKATFGVEMWSDQVIIAVTTGVTVSVLAAFLGVIRGLFGNNSNGQK